jgi:FAD synthetase
MGNRRTDPYSQDLQPFTQSSEGWPDFMRVFPILEWDYRSVWQFLRSFDLPYCSLYDQGFTSLGEKHNSQPNAALKVAETE